MDKKQCLEMALGAVADRGLNYGRPEDNFQRIADLWNTYIAGKRDPMEGITPLDVAMMMTLMKIARLQNSPGHLDSWVDIAGYAACGAEIASTPAS